MPIVAPKPSELDYNSLYNKITKRAYKLSEVKDQLETVAFGVVKFKDADKAAELWEVQSSDDGDYIVALYEEPEQTKTANNWSVYFTKTASTLQVSYKNDPLVKIACKKLGIPPSELGQVSQYLPEKLASNKKLVKALLNELNFQERQEVLAKYPELE